MNMSFLDNPKIQKLISLFNRRPERLGIDIEGGVARIVRLVKDKSGQYFLGAYGKVDYNFNEPTIEQQGSLQSEIGRIGGGLQKVAVGIEHPTLRVRRMVFAKMPEGDLLEAIKWNFREHVEVPMEKYVVNYTPLDGDIEGNKQAIVAYGVSQAAIDTYLERFKSLGLKTVSLEPNATAILAAFDLNRVLDDAGYHVCISFGRSLTNFVILKGKEMLFSRPLADISSDSLIKQLARDLNISPEKASAMLNLWIKEAKDEDGGDDLQEKFKSSIRLFFSKLVIEIQRSIDAFCIQFEVDRVDKIHVCGYGASYPDLMSHVSKTIGVQTDAFNPFSSIMSKNIIEKDIAKIASYYTVAVGLAIP